MHWYSVIPSIVLILIGIAIVVIGIFYDNTAPIGIGAILVGTGIVIIVLDLRSCFSA